MRLNGSILQYSKGSNLNQYNSDNSQFVKNKWFIISCGIKPEKIDLISNFFFDLKLHYNLKTDK